MCDMSNRLSRCSLCSLPDLLEEDFGIEKLSFLLMADSDIDKRLLIETAERQETAD